MARKASRLPSSAGTFAARTSAKHPFVSASGPAGHCQHRLSDGRRFLRGGAQNFTVQRIGKVRAVSMKTLQDRDHVNGWISRDGPDRAAHPIFVTAGSIESHSDIDRIARPHIVGQMKHALQRRQRLRGKSRQFHSVLDALIGYRAQFPARGAHHPDTERFRQHAPRCREFDGLRQLVEIIRENEIRLPQRLPINGPGSRNHPGVPARNFAAVLRQSGLQQNDRLSRRVRAFRQFEQVRRIAESLDECHDNPRRGILNRIGDQIFSAGDRFVAGRGQERQAMPSRDALQQRRDRPALADRSDRTRRAAGGDFEARNRHAIGETQEAEAVRPERRNSRVRAKTLNPFCRSAPAAPRSRKPPA